MNIYKDRTDIKIQWLKDKLESNPGGFDCWKSNLYQREKSTVTVVPDQKIVLFVKCLIKCANGLKFAYFILKIFFFSFFNLWCINLL